MKNIFAGLGEIHIFHYFLYSLISLAPFIYIFFIDKELDNVRLLLTIVGTAFFVILTAARVYNHCQRQ